MANANKNASDYKGKTKTAFPTYTVVANAPPAALNTGAIIILTAGGTGSVLCLAVSNGTNWKQIAVGANAI